jgi:hypothetical protein
MLSEHSEFKLQVGDLRIAMAKEILKMNLYLGLSLVRLRTVF